MQTVPLIKKEHSHIAGHVEIMEFIIHRHKMILGHDWLQTHDPKINWDSKQIDFRRCPQGYHIIQTTHMITFKKAPTCLTGKHSLYTRVFSKKKSIPCPHLDLESTMKSNSKMIQDIYNPK